MTTETRAPQDVVGWLDYYLVKKAPAQLPDEAKEWIVRYGPFITIVLLLIAVPTLLFALGVGATYMPFAGIGYATGFTYLAVGTLAEMGLMAAALPGLFERRMTGWRLMFYSALVSLGVSLLRGAIVGGLAGGLISLYILFQIRSLYKA
ncbi:MAG TPA: hypothetical protein VFB07_02340 [Vicinamibacterales bacterium]|nr:hypothetical protein [Vicinamibacterales bacterium]